MFRRRSKKGAQNMQESLLEWIKRVRSAGAALAQRGDPVGRYFEMVDDTSVATQRDTKDHLPRRLKESAKVPQVITVQPRGGDEGGAYMIIPLRTMVETLETRIGNDQFVPITASLREIGGDIEMPAFAPRASGRRLRSSSPSPAAPAGVG